MSRNKSDRETWGELHFAQLTYRKEHDIAAWSFLHDYLGFENPTPYQMSLLYKAGMFSNPSTTENSPGKEMRNALSAFFLSQVVPKYIRPTTLHVHAMLQEWCHENKQISGFNTCICTEIYAVLPTNVQKKRRFVLVRQRPVDLDINFSAISIALNNIIRSCFGTVVSG